MMSRRLIFNFVALASLLLFTFQTVSAETIEQLKQKIDNLGNRTKALETESSQYRRLVSETRSEAQTLQNTIKILNAEIGALQLEISQTENSIEGTGYKIQLTELEAQKTYDKIEQQRLQIAQILRLINTHDTTSVFEVMLLEDSFAAFLNNRGQVITLEANIKAFMDDLKLQKEALEQAAETLKAEKSRLEDLSFKLGSQQVAVATQRSTKGSLLAKTKGEEKTYQQLLNKAETEKAALLKEIKVLEQRVEAQKNYLKFAESKSIPPPGTKIFIWPEATYRLTQGFGMTVFAKRGAYGGSPHNGIDMASGAGTPILAAAEGIVFASGTNGGWGNWIAIKHANELVTLYAHMIKPTHTSVGQKVTAGQTIGYEGSTGFATGSHLHFSVYSKFFTYNKGNEVYFNYFDGTLNPLDYL